MALVFVGGSMISNPVVNGKVPDAYRPVSEGEGLDRETLGLPGRQLDLIKALGEDDDILHRIAMQCTVQFAGSVG